MNPLPLILAPALAIAGLSQAIAGLSQDDRIFSFVYEVEVPGLRTGTGPIDIFIPLAPSNERQEVLKREIRTPIRGVERTEPRYGNRFWHGHVERFDGKPIHVEMEYLVRRKIYRVDVGSGMPHALLTQRERDLYLGPDSKGPIKGPLIDQIRANLPRGARTSLEKARTIYDYVIDNMEYKKTGTGWGNGDVLWACTKKYGNCTDFHALFISLIRAEGIPVRFDIGFQVPESANSGEVPGYHCWAEFHVPTHGWVPVDASEAWKHRERRNLYFGTQLADRILFTTGRDIQLGDGHRTAPLNYFIYPHVEVAGKRLRQVTTRFRYRKPQRESPGAL